MRTCDEDQVQTILLWRVPKHDVLLDGTRFDAGSEQASAECPEQTRAKLLRRAIVGEYLASAGAPKSLMQSDRWSRCIDWFEQTKQMSVEILTTQTDFLKRVILAERVSRTMLTQLKSFHAEQRKANEYTLPAERP